MPEFIITVPKNQIWYMRGVEDISYIIRQRAAMEKLGDMGFEFVGTKEN